MARSPWSGLPPETARRFGYGTHAARLGNNYTARQVRQLVEKLAGAEPALPVWDKDGRLRDAQRPGVDPYGLATPETVARPFLTVESRGHGSLDFRRPGNQLNDHRHMNADFGAALFAAFALTLRRNMPATTPQTQGD